MGGQVLYDCNEAFVPANVGRHRGHLVVKPPPAFLSRGAERVSGGGTACALRQRASVWRLCVSRALLTSHASPSLSPSAPPSPRAWPGLACARGGRWCRNTPR